MNFAAELFFSALGLIMSVVVISEIVAKILNSFGGEK